MPAWDDPEPTRLFAVLDAYRRGEDVRHLLAPEDPSQAELPELEHGSACEQCNGVRWIIPERARHQRGDAHSQPCPFCSEGRAIHERRTLRLLGATNVPDEFLDKDFASYYAVPTADRAAGERTETWARGSDRSSLYLYGPVGAMKSGLAWCAARHRLEASGTGVLFRQTSDLYSQIRNCMDHPGDGPTVDDLVEELKAADQTLILDDIGTENPTAWVIETLTRILSGRQRRPTILTSNLTLAELEEFFGGIAGQRITSRIMGMCDRGRNVVHVQGPDQRAPEARR